MPPNVTTPHWYDVLQMLKREVFRDLRVCVPGSVSGINGDGTVNVAVGLMQHAQQRELPFGQDISYPPLVNCPVFTLQGGGVGAVMPVAVGDECLVVFSDRCIGNWILTGQPMPQPVLRMHDISDGFVLVGLNSQANNLLTPLDATEGGICTVGSAVGAKVAIDNVTDKISIKNDTAGSLLTILQLLVTGILGMTAGGNAMVDATGNVATAVADLAVLLK